LRVNLDCIPCFQRQALQAIRFVTDDDAVHESVLREVMKRLQELGWESSPPTIARQVHSLIRQLGGNRDPYARAKRESNDCALRLYPGLKQTVEGSADPVMAAIRFAIAGNIMDFGAFQEFDLEKALHSSLKMRLAVDDYRRFRAVLGNARKVLYFADNAGEIVLDRLLIETMKDQACLEQVSLVLKGGPLINDATVEDAIYVGLEKVPGIEFLKVGNGEPGTGPERISREVEGWIARHDLVISKGQGNYEDLSELHNIFFMLIAKCPLVASDLGVNPGDIVLKYRP